MSDSSLLKAIIKAVSDHSSGSGGATITSRKSSMAIVMLCSKLADTKAKGRCLNNGEGCGRAFVDNYPSLRMYNYLSVIQ